MLIARGHKILGRADLRWAFGFVPGVWCAVVDRQGLVLDTRFVPAAAEPPRARSCLYLLVEGAWVVHGPGGAEIPAPRTLAVTEEHLEGASGRRSLTFAAAGSRFRSIEIHVEDAELGVRCGAQPKPLPLEGPTLDRARALFDVGVEVDETLQARYADLIEDLAAGGLLTASVAHRARRAAPRSFRMLWAALRPMVERLYLTPTLQEVGEASGMSTRQLDRYVQSFVASFGLVGDRWRGATLHIRLKLAILLLSAEGASVGDVGAAVGYGSPDAMARAFRDAGLPPPSVVQQRLRETT